MCHMIHCSIDIPFEIKQVGLHGDFHVDVHPDDRLFRSISHTTVEFSSLYIYISLLVAAAYLEISFNSPNTQNIPISTACPIQDH